MAQSNALEMYWFLHRFVLRLYDFLEKKKKKSPAFNNTRHRCLLRWNCFYMWALTSFAMKAWILKSREREITVNNELVYHFI